MDARQPLRPGWRVFRDVFQIGERNGIQVENIKRFILISILNSSSLLPSLRHRAVHVPILLCLMIVSLSSLNCSQNFNLLFITNFTGTSLRIDLVFVIISVKMLGNLIAMIIHTKLGIKMILLLGK